MVSAVLSDWGYDHEVPLAAVDNWLDGRTDEEIYELSKQQWRTDWLNHDHALADGLRDALDPVVGKFFDWLSLHYELGVAIEDPPDNRWQLVISDAEVMAWLETGRPELHRLIHASRENERLRREAELAEFRRRQEIVHSRFNFVSAAIDAIDFVGVLLILPMYWAPVLLEAWVDKRIDRGDAAWAALSLVLFIGLLWLMIWGIFRFI